MQTICWVDNSIVDWTSAGKRYTLDGQYAFIYQKPGIKGLLLKNGEILREINRSYYCADVYEYPAIFVTLDNRTFLVHCSFKYCRLDFEDVETGQIITGSQDRDPSDFFHSRLEISPNDKYLI